MLLLLYTQGVVFALVCAGGIRDNISVGTRKLVVGSFGKQQNNWKNIALGFVFVSLQ